MANEELFKDFEGKKEKGKMEKDTVEIKIRFNKIWLERAIFIVIILILLVLVFYNPFGKYRCEKGLSEIKSEPVIEEEGNKTTESVIEEEPEEDVVVEEESKTEPEPEKELSGKITLSIEDIQLGTNKDTNKTQVQSITLKIDNQKKIFTPMVYVYWYDSADTALAKKPRTMVNYTGAIPTGTVKIWKLDDELKARYLTPDDESKEIFKVEMYDAKDPVAPIDTKTETKNTD